MKLKLVALVVIAVVVVGGLAFVRHQAASPKVLSATAATPQARNTVRRQHLQQLSAALKQYLVEKGRLPLVVPAAATEICSSDGAVCRAAKLVDLGFLPSNGYLAAIPLDPVGGPGAHGTGYFIGHDPMTGGLQLTAPRAEAGATISVEVK